MSFNIFSHLFTIKWIRGGFHLSCDYTLFSSSFLGDDEFHKE